MNKVLVFMLWLLFLFVAIVSFALGGFGGLIVYLLIIGGAIAIFK